MRILVASDHPLIREGLAGLARSSYDAELVGAASTWQSLLVVAGEVHPDLVILGVERPRIGWIRAVQQIRRRSSLIRIAFVSCDQDPDYLSEMRNAGALTKFIADRDSNEIATFIQQFSGSQSGSESSGTLANSANTLTPRELEILGRVANGEMSHEIAGVLAVSVRTVEFHRANILRKTGARSVADLTRYAMENGVSSKYRAESATA